MSNAEHTQESATSSLAVAQDECHRSQKGQKGLASLQQGPLVPALIPVWWAAKTTRITNEQCPQRVSHYYCTVPHTASSSKNIMCLEHLASQPPLPPSPCSSPLPLCFPSVHKRFYAMHHFLNDSIWKSLKGSFWNIQGLFAFPTQQAMHLGEDNGAQGPLRGACAVVCSSQGKRCFPGAWLTKRAST